jgi:hypothetical protein
LLRLGCDRISRNAAMLGEPAPLRQISTVLERFSPAAETKQAAGAGIANRHPRFVGQRQQAVGITKQQ